MSDKVLKAPSLLHEISVKVPYGKLETRHPATFNIEKLWGLKLNSKSLDKYTGGVVRYSHDQQFCLLLVEKTNCSIIIVLVLDIVAR